MDSVKKEKDSDDEDERLKFDSEKFDPLFALYSPNLKINPQKNHVFQNFAMFEAALKRVGVYGLASKKKVTAHRTEKGAGAKVSIEDANAVRNFLPHQMPIKSTPSSSQQRNLSKFMENVEGPFAMLRKCRESGNHAKIYIRNNKTIVGHTMGRIIAFDKHMNIILEDATETFKRRKFKYSEDKYVGESKDCSQRLLNLGITLPESKVKSVNRKNCIVSRYVGKVLIRCECIALIVKM